MSDTKSTAERLSPAEKARREEAVAKKLEDVAAREGDALRARVKAATSNPLHFMAVMVAMDTICQTTNRLAGLVETMGGSRAEADKLAALALTEALASFKAAAAEVDAAYAAVKS